MLKQYLPYKTAYLTLESNIFLQPLPEKEWNGEQHGYSITYHSLDEVNRSKEVSIMDENANSYTIGGLAEWTEYEVKMRALNAMGYSPYSEAVTDRTWESGK